VPSKKVKIPILADSRQGWGTLQIHYSQPGGPPEDFSFLYLPARYCWSLTCSIQSTTFPSSFSWMAMWVMAVVGVAPCQCFSPGENQTTSPGPDLLDRSAFALSPAAARRDDEGLTERMRVPCGTCTRLEGNAGALNQRRIGRLKKRIDPHRAREPL
jgi:hypothetical protein